MKKKQRIFNPKWLEFHPYDTAAPSDLYYIQLSNKVLDEIDRIMDQDKIQDLIFLEEQERIDLACVLACHFEDEISNTGIWKAISQKIFEKTGKHVPFYPIADYAEDDIYVENLKFICWHYFQKINENNFCISPLNHTITAIAEATFALFDDEYETAPENERLQKFFNVPFGAKFVDLERKLLWVSTDSYMTLFNVNILDRNLQFISESMEDSDSKEEIQGVCFDYITDFSINNELEFFGLRAPQLLSVCTGKMNPYYNILKEMGKVKTGFFLFEGIEATFVKLRHIATDKVIELDLSETVKFPKDLQSDALVLQLGIVNWRQFWVLTGGVKTYEKNDEIMNIVKSDEAEKRFFDTEEPVQTYNEAEQDEIVKRAVEIITKDDPELIEEDIWWNMLRDVNLSADYIVKAVKENKYPELKFPEDGGRTLMEENIDFILSYLRQPTELMEYSEAEEEKE